MRTLLEVDNIQLKEAVVNMATPMVIKGHAMEVSEEEIPFGISTRGKSFLLVVVVWFLFYFLFGESSSYGWLSLFGNKNIVHTNGFSNKFVSDGTYKDRNGLWRLFEVLKESGFIPPEVIRAYEIYCNAHPSAGKSVNEKIDKDSGVSASQRPPTSSSDTKTADDPGKTTSLNGDIPQPSPEQPCPSVPSGPSAPSAPSDPSSLHSKTSILSEHPSLATHFQPQNQNLSPLGPHQVFSCLVPDCVYSTPAIDNYRMHVHIFHPHLQMDLLSPVIPQVAVGVRSNGIKHHVHPPLPLAQPNPGYPAFFVPGSPTSSAMPPMETLGTIGHFSGSRPKDSHVSVERSIEMHKCVALDCDYYSESLQGLKMHTRWRHPEISSSIVGSFPPQLVSRDVTQERERPHNRPLIPLQIKKVMNCIVSTCDYRATSNHALKMHVTMTHPGVDKDELDSKIRSCPIPGCERNGMSMHGLKLHCIKAHPGYELVHLLADSNALLGRQSSEPVNAPTLVDNVNDLSKDFESDGEIQEFDSIEPFDESFGQILPEDPSLSFETPIPNDAPSPKSTEDAQSSNPNSTIKPFGCTVPGCNFRAYTSQNVKVHIGMKHPGVGNSAFKGLDDEEWKPKFSRKRGKKVHKCSVAGCVGRKALMSLRGLRVHMTMRHPKLSQVDDKGNIPTKVDPDEMISDQEEEEEAQGAQDGDREEEEEIANHLQGKQLPLPKKIKEEEEEEPKTPTASKDKTFTCPHEDCTFSASSYQGVNSHKRCHLSRSQLQVPELPCPVEGCEKKKQGIKGLRVHMTRCHPEFSAMVNDDGLLEETGLYEETGTDKILSKTSTPEVSRSGGTTTPEADDMQDSNLRDRSLTPSNMASEESDTPKLYRRVFECANKDCHTIAESSRGIAMHLSKAHGINKASNNWDSSFANVYECEADESCVFRSKNVIGVKIHLGAKHRHKSSSPSVATTKSADTTTRNDKPDDKKSPKREPKHENLKTAAPSLPSYLEAANRKSFPCLVPGCSFVSPSFRGLKFHTSSDHATGGELVKQDLESAEPSVDQVTSKEAALERSIPCSEDTCEGVMFKTEKDLKIHQRRRHPDSTSPSNLIKLKKCPIDDCDFIFKTSLNYMALLQHYKRLHPGQTIPDEYRHKNKCPVPGCQHATKKAVALKQHVTSSHRDWEPNEDSPWFQEMKAVKMGGFNCVEPNCTFFCNSAMGLAVHKRAHLKEGKRRLETEVMETTSVSTKSPDADEMGNEADVEDEDDSSAGPSKRVRKQSTLYQTYKEFLCGLCNEAFEAASSLTAHTRERHPDRPGCFPCPFCEKLFWSPAFLQSHISLHHEEQMDNGTEGSKTNVFFGTRLPDASLPTTSSGSRVILNDIADRLPVLRSPERDRSKILVCKVCALVFEEMDDLNQHMTSAHPTATSPHRSSSLHESATTATASTISCTSLLSNASSGNSRPGPACSKKTQLSTYPNHKLSKTFAPVITNVLPGPSNSTSVVLTFEDPFLNSATSSANSAIPTPSAATTEDDQKRKTLPASVFKSQFRCPKCSEIFHSDSKLLLHVNAAHGLEAAMNLYPCNKCKKSFRSSYFLNLHFEKYHPPSSSQYQSPPSGVILSSSSSMTHDISQEPSTSEPAKSMTKEHDLDLKNDFVHLNFKDTKKDTKLCEKSAEICSSVTMEGQSEEAVGKKIKEIVELPLSLDLEEVNAHDRVKDTE